MSAAACLVGLTPTSYGLTELCSWLTDVSFGGPVEHKLRVLVRVSPDPVRVTLEVAGCLTQQGGPSLFHILKRAGRFGAGTPVSIDLHGASHLDPEVLLLLREIAASGTGRFRVILEEPVELPVCLLHVGSGADAPAPAGKEAQADVLLDPGLDEACSPMRSELETVDGLAPSEYFEGPLDPMVTVRALSDAALSQLADVLYRHLDTASPSYGAHTWYELATEEIQYRRHSDPDGPAEGERAAGQSLG